MLFHINHTKSIVVAAIPFFFIGGWFFLNKTFTAPIAAIGDGEEKTPKRTTPGSAQWGGGSKNFDSLPANIESTSSVSSSVAQPAAAASSVSNKSAVTSQLMGESLTDEVESEEMLEINPGVDSLILQVSQFPTPPTPKSNEMAVKCKLAEDIRVEQCSFAKVTEATGSNRGLIDYDALQKVPFSANVATNYFDSPKTLYKIRITDAFLSKWNINKDQNIEVYKIEGDKNKDVILPSEKPIITLNAQLGFKDINKLYGKTQYFFASLKDIKVLGADANTPTLNEIELINKRFKCSLPKVSFYYQKCQIYEFDPNKSDLSQKSIKPPLKTPAKAEKTKQYIIKFQDLQRLNQTEFTNADELKLEIHPKQSDKTILESRLTFDNLTQLMMYHEPWEKGIAIMLKNFPKKS